MRLEVDYVDGFDETDRQEIMTDEEAAAEQQRQERQIEVEAATWYAARGPAASRKLGPISLLKLRERASET